MIHPSLYSVSKVLILSILVFSVFSCRQNNAGHHFKNGNAKFNLKDYSGAIKDLDEAIELKPEFTDAYYVRALCNSKISKYDKALSDFNKVIELNPDYKDAYINRAYYVRTNTGDYKGAIEDYNKFLELNQGNDNSFALNNRGFAKLKLNDTEGAMIDIQHSIETNPNNSYAYKNRALVFLAMDSLSRVCEDLSKAESLNYSKDYDNLVKELQAEHCSEN